MRYGDFAGVKSYAPKRTAKDLGFDAPEDFQTFIEGLLDAVSVRVNRILPQGVITTADEIYPAVVEVVERRVAGVIPLQAQLSISPIIKVDDFTVQIVRTGKLWEGLAEELQDLFESGSGANSGFEIFHTGGT